jgi:hypothetical protein
MSCEHGRVPAFDRTDGLDWQLLRRGPVTLFGDAGTFVDAMVELAAAGYLVTSFDGARWHDRSAMMADFATSFGFPEWFGHNLDALAECLADVAARRDEHSVPGSVVAIDRIDVLAAADGAAAQALLDILADTSRQALLHGRRLLVLLSTADPTLRFAPVGATPVTLRGVGPLR